MAVVAIISLAVVIGAVIQGSIGFGYALVAVPAMVLLLPWAVPVTPLFLALPMTLLMSAREWRSIDLSGFWCIIRISPILSYAFVPLGYTVICCRLGVRISTPSSDTNSGTITFLTDSPFSAAVDEEDLLLHGFLHFWADVELLDDRSQSLAHDAASSPARPPFAGGMFWLSRKRFVES